jgi:CPA2 family monovalent cation:H+ antiporter-2
VLVGLFFVTIGMQLDLGIVAAAPSSVLGWILVFLSGKAVLVAFVVRLLGWPAPVATRVGIVLAHGGEFGLLLLTQAIAAGTIDPDPAYAMLVALAFTMGLAPVLIQRSAALAGFVGSAAMAAHADDDAVALGSQGLSDHVILCGCGRVGRLVALVLEAARIPYVAIERDLTRFREAKEAGHNVVFADASRSGVLHRAGAERARLLVVTFDQRRAVERLLHQARHRNPEIVTIVSAADDRNLSSLLDAGASVVLPENLAAGLALADQILLLEGLPQEQATSLITEVRVELNPELRGRVGT